MSALRRKKTVPSSSKIFHYQAIEDSLRDRISDGIWKEGDVIISNRGICAEFGVSAITANRVLDKLAADDIIARKRGVGNILLGSRQPRGLSALRLALVCPFRTSQNLFFDGYYSVMAEAFVCRVEEQGGSVQMAYFRPEAINKLVSIEAWLGYETQGLVFFGVSGVCREAAALAEKFALPAVFVDSYQEGFPSVVSDHMRTARLVCSKLYEAEHRKIAYVGSGEKNVNLTNESERKAILPGVAESMGLEIGTRVTQVRDADNPETSRNVLRWIREEAVTAIIVSTFGVYSHLAREFEHAGISPMSVTFVGMDTWNLRWSDPDSLPPLSGAITELSRMGSTAFEMIQSVAAQPGDTMGRAQIETVPPVWVQGETLLRT